MMLLRIAMGAFGGAGIITKLIIVGSLLAALAAAYGVWHVHVYRKGYSAAIAAIARQDARAIEAAHQARSALSDCHNRGLRWDQSTGKCEGR